MRLSEGRSVRAFLRDGTRDAHAAVDDAFSALPLGEREGYLALLQAHAAVLPPLETALQAAGVATVLPDWAARRRSPALLADLRRLGGAAPAGLEPPVLEGEAAVLGAAYVLEGSRLGARILERRLAAGDPDLARSAGYLRHGAGAVLWSSFLARLEAAPAARREPERLLEAARAAFACFHAAAPR
jgi:heme oxygenase